MTIKEKIEQTLQPLIGEPLSDMSRFFGIQSIEFGVQRPCKNRKGQDTTLADVSLHISCFWSISGPDGTIVSSGDFGPNGSRRDEKARPFYRRLEHNPPTVEALEADDAGALRVTLSEGYSLTVLPREGSDDLYEEWRYLPKDEEERHLVITRHGIEA